MSRHKLFYIDAKTVRDSLRDSKNIANAMHELETELVRKLYSIDQERYYVRLGFKSLRGYCIQGLRFSRTQSQRIVTAVRRYDPTVNIVDK
jgi:hypothetical protein